MSAPLKILFLANWPLRSKNGSTDYAFFSHWTRKPSVTLMGAGGSGFVSRIEKNILRFYLIAPFVAFFRSFFHDIVIAYSSQVGLPLALMLRFAFRRKVRLVVFDVESFGRVKSGWRLSLLRFAAARIDLVVHASSRQTEYYGRYLPEITGKLAFIPIGIGRYDKTRPLGDPGKGPIVASGHHGKAFRDWALLLQAYAPIAGRSGLLVVGRESLSPEERDGVPIPEGCHFEPYLAVEKYRKRIENAPFIVLPLPEREQSLGQLSVLFCMAMGKAVVGTRVMGIEDYVEDGVTGILTRPGDVDAMRGAMSRLLDNPEEAVRMGMAGYHRLQEKFTDRVMGLAWEKTISALMDGTFGTFDPTTGIQS